MFTVNSFLTSKLKNGSFKYSIQCNTLKETMFVKNDSVNHPVYNMYFALVINLVSFEIENCKQLFIRII